MRWGWGCHHVGVVGRYYQNQRVHQRFGRYVYGVAFLDETVVTEDEDTASELRHMPRTPEDNSTISSAVNGSK